LKNEDLMFETEQLQERLEDMATKSYNPSTVDYKDPVSAEVANLRKHYSEKTEDNSTMKNLVAIIEDLAKVQNTDINPRLLPLKEKIKNTELQLKLQRARLQKTQKMRSNYVTELRQPKQFYMTGKSLDYKALKHAVVQFDPSVSPAMDFTHTWEDILAFGEAQGFSENCTWKPYCLAAKVQLESPLET